MKTLRNNMRSLKANKTSLNIALTITAITYAVLATTLTMRIAV